VHLLCRLFNKARQTMEMDKGHGEMRKKDKRRVERKTDDTRVYAQNLKGHFFVQNFPQRIGEW